MFTKPKAMDGYGENLAIHWSLNSIVAILCWYLLFQNGLSENVGNVSSVSSDSILRKERNSRGRDDIRFFNFIDRWLSESDDFPTLCPQSCFTKNVCGRTKLVFLWVLIHNMAVTSESDMNFHLELTLFQLWTDHRFYYKYLSRNFPWDNVFAIHIKVFDRIWKPDTYFRNSRQSHIHQVTTPLKTVLFTNRGGYILKTGLNLQFHCPMKLHNFPMDEHICTLIISSYSYKAKEIMYCWNRVNLLKSKELRDVMIHSQFIFIKHRIRYLVGNYKSGNFSEIHLDIHVKRQAGYYYIQVYLPCCLIVVTSWVSFWINQEATGDRIGLATTSVVTLSTFVSETRKSLPEVDYVTALDVYILICFIFGIASVFECVGVQYFAKVAGQKKTEQSNNHIDDSKEENIAEAFGNLQQPVHEVMADAPLRLLSSTRITTKVGDKILQLTSAPTTAHEEHSRRTTNCCMNCICRLLSSEKSTANRRQRAKGRNSLSKFDKVSRILFPLSFVAITVIYWCIYTRKVVTDDYNIKWIDDEDFFNYASCSNEMDK